MNELDRIEAAKKLLQAEQDQQLLTAQMARIVDEAGPEAQALMKRWAEAEGEGYFLVRKLWNYYSNLESVYISPENKKQLDQERANNNRSK